MRTDISEHSELGEQSWPSFHLALGATPGELLVVTRLLWLTVSTIDERLLVVVVVVVSVFCLLLLELKKWLSVDELDADDRSFLSERQLSLRTCLPRE